ncbi:flavin reductase family protein [Streptomyces sp. RKAG293]|uniref:flavin reductase family protein n=1 Tax=Streptomyces sp. RKAG293 TaxID=2893403 RepID=UPI0020333837|nr:flavin reductase family protein [Streptomyces sp. RKAG293]MCM2420620.1 flavin reductase family protein [Streptomyces sp. RKAG293]
MVTSDRASAPARSGSVARGPGLAEAGTELPTAARFRASSRLWPTGVAVLTTKDATGAPHGTTVNSLTTISLDPPLLLVSLGSSSRALEHISDTRVFALNVLSRDQEPLAQNFAQPGRRGGADAFAEIPTEAGSRTGCLLLTDSIGYFECGAQRIEAVADHCLVIGAVLSCGDLQTAPPLVFANAAFRQLR